MPPHRQLRADAVRNREKIVRAAGEQFALYGSEVQMDVIAAAAGVAVGTLYRNFPAKSDLVAAVMREFAEARLGDLEATLERLKAGAPAEDELRDLAQRSVEALAANRAAKGAAHALGAYQDASLRQQFERAIGAIVAHGRNAGVLRADATGDDFMLLVATAPADLTPEARSRWLALFLDGLAARSQG